MMLTLYYDTETTGLPLDHLDEGHPEQPALVQVAAILWDDEYSVERASLSLIVNPGRHIPDDAAKVHGIDTALAQAVGVQRDTALRVLIGIWKLATRRVGHNEAYDAKVIRMAIARLVHQGAPDWSWPVASRWTAGRAECTATLATPILNLPPTERMIAAGRTHAKTPKLGEAYRHFIGHDLEGAHDALVDVRACMAVHRAILTQKQGV